MEEMVEAFEAEKDVKEPGTDQEVDATQRKIPNVYFRIGSKKMTFGGRGCGHSCSKKGFDGG